MNIHLRCLLLIAWLLALTLVAFPQNKATPAEKIASVFGENIHYFEVGQGPVVILLHGLGGVKEMWLPNIGALAAAHHVYAIDQIGFGQSDKPLLDYRIATFSDFLYGFMQSQHVSKATLVGNSLGGWIALEFTAAHPDMVDKLVLVDSAGMPWKPGAAPTVNLNPASLAATRTMLESLFYNRNLVTDAFVEQVFLNRIHNNDGYTIQRTMAGFAAENQLEDKKLASIHAPTLVLWGRNDELLGMDMAEKLRDGISGAKMVVIEQCGHIPQIEKPAEFNRALLEFLGN
jgi:2-hydroxy-6-oxonona-2,4-dienedioate hydrolase